MALDFARHAELYLSVSSSVGSSGEKEYTKAVDESNEKIDRFLLALNVNERLWSFKPDIRFSWLQHQDGTRAELRNRELTLRSAFDDPPRLQDFSEAAELTTTIDIVYSGEPESRFTPVMTSFAAVRLASYAHNTSMRFLQEAIALEALCSASDTTEMTHRIATTCAILLGANTEERKTLYEKAKRLYGIRSRVIHGSGRRVSIQELKDIEHLTRRVLRRILRNDILPNYETSSKHREFLLDLIFER